MVSGQTYFILKDTGHMFFIDALLEVFPDAKIIHLVRNPESVYASSCSGTALLRQFYYSPKDTSVAAERKVVLEQMEDTARCMLRSLERCNPTLKVVQYSDLVGDPLSTVRDIYKTLELSGGQVSAEYAAKIEEYLADNPSNKHGKHCYRWPEDGLSADEVRKRFRFYTERFLSGN